MHTPMHHIFSLLFFLFTLSFFSCSPGLDEDIKELTTLEIVEEAVVEVSDEAAAEKGDNAAGEKEKSSPEKPAEEKDQKEPQPTATTPATNSTTPAPIATQPVSVTASEGKVQPMLNVPTFGYYKLPMNGSPLFSPECLQADDPVACSNQTLQEWLSQQLRYRSNGLSRGEYSVQYLSFEVRFDGKIGQVSHYKSAGSVFCPKCIEIAEETIREMPSWVPATRNGHPVNKVVNLPVRFQVI